MKNENLLVGAAGIVAAILLVKKRKTTAVGAIKSYDNMKTQTDQLVRGDHTEMENFKNGVWKIKSGRKTVAKIYYLPDFFGRLNVSWNEKYPFVVEINGMAAGCSTLQEAKNLLYSEIL